jgi:hypothetical protein
MSLPAHAGVNDPALQATCLALELRRRVEQPLAHEWCAAVAHTVQIGISGGLL